MEQETEIKLKIEDLDTTLQKIAAMGCLKVSDFEFEDNLLFDFDDFSLKERGIILRIREYGKKYTLTVKEKIHDDPLFKVRSEAEIIVNDAERLKNILESLGLKVVYRYQKCRAEYSLGTLSIFVDRTPIGDFIELEGGKDAIDAVARSLGYGREDYIRLSYRKCHMEYLKERGLPPSDMLFERDAR